MASKKSNKPARSPAPDEASSSTSAPVAVSRKTGKPKTTHGGARSGAGRPRDKLPKQVVDRLGAPPENPVELRTWNARLLAEVQWLCIRGEIGSELAATLRANAGAIERALPPPPRDERRRDDGDDDDDQDEDDDGPELTEIATNGGELRVG